MKVISPSKNKKDKAFEMIVLGVIGLFFVMAFFSPMEAQVTFYPVGWAFMASFWLHFLIYGERRKTK